MIDRAPDRVLIFGTAIVHGNQTFEQGDAYEPKALGFSDILEATMKKTKQLLPLTRETYQNCMARRPKGLIGRGFSIEYLLEHGILDKHAAEDLERFPHGAVGYKGYWIVTRRNGTLVNYEIVDEVGTRMRDRMCKTVEGGREYIDTLPPAKEPSDGVHLESSARDAA